MHGPQRTTLSRIRSTLLVALLVLFPLSLSAQQPAFDKAEFATRRARLAEQVKDGVALVFAAEEHALPVRFRQSPDFYYLTGIEEPGAVLMVSGASGNAMVFAPKRPNWKVQSEGPGLREMEKPQDVYGLPVQPMEDFFTTLNFASGNVKKLYLPLTPHDDLLHARFEVKMLTAMHMAHPLYGHEPHLASAIEKIHAAQPQLELADLSPVLDGMRWVKTPYKIERLKRSGRIGAGAVAEAMRGTRPGMYEYEIAAAAQYINTRMGAQGDAFPPIVASGPNTIIVHYTANDRQMQTGELVYIDYGSDYDYYTSDITRTWPVSGRFTSEQEKMYRCVLDASKAIVAALRPGITPEQLKDVAEKVYDKHGYKKEFLESGRYIGHFIGLSVHDVGSTWGPDAQKPLMAGVVFNVEPILQFPDRKIHIRLEDTVLITERGAENLTAGVPVEVDQVYALIKERGVNSMPAARERAQAQP